MASGIFKNTAAKGHHRVHFNLVLKASPDAKVFLFICKWTKTHAQEKTSTMPRFQKEVQSNSISWQTQ